MSKCNIFTDISLSESPELQVPGKWSKYKKRYNPKWETEPALKNWVSPTSEEDIKGGKPQVFCKLCEKYLRAHHSDLIAHSKREKHKAKEIALFGPIPSESLSEHINIYDSDTEPEKPDETHMEDEQIEAIAIELFGGEDPLLKRVKPEVSSNTEAQSIPKATTKRARLQQSNLHQSTNESLSMLDNTCGVHSGSQNTKCKWQQLAELKILAVKEKRQQQRLQYNMNKAEFDLRMEIMSEEFKLKKRKLQLEILSMERNLKIKVF